jgi:hypothetical protein
VTFFDRELVSPTSLDAVTTSASSAMPQVYQAQAPHL